jgi:hypothetical protein
MKILVVYYSQSGQLFQIIQSLLRPLEEDCQITYEALKPEKAYPFPWPPIEFFDVQPESVLVIPTALKPFTLNADDNFDLVILGYQPWFLSPSIPMTSFLKSPEAAKCLKNKPVVTVSGCRNMWLMAQEEIKQQLQALSAPLIWNVPFVDRNPNSVSIFTIVSWMFTGKRDYFKFLPRAGVSSKDIRDASRFGVILQEYFKKQKKNPTESNLSNLSSLFDEHPTDVNPRFIGVEKAAKRIFKIWAKFIRSKGGPGDLSRRPYVRGYIVYLSVALTLLFPLTYLVYLLQRVFNKKGLQKKVDYFSGRFVESKGT